jgi:hypothetical protein
MQSFFLLLALCCAAVPAQLMAQQPFHSIVYHGSQQLVISTGVPHGFAVEGSKKDAAAFSITVKDSVLHITENAYFFKSPVRVRVSCPQLAQLTLRGQAQAVNDVSIREPLRVQLYDQAMADLELEAVPLLEATLEGKALLRVAGSAQALHVSLKADALLRAADLSAAQADVTHMGLQDAQVQATERLTVVSTGGGVVYYRGKPHIQQEVTGNGDVRPLK